MSVQPEGPPKKIKKKMSIYDHAVARINENSQFVENDWESSPAYIRQFSGSVY